MNNNLIVLSQLKMASIKSKDLCAQVAAAATEAIEEVSARIITMEQVNQAIDTAINGAIEGVYYGTGT